MFQVQQITDNARQKLSLILPDGTQFSMSIYFSSAQVGWFISNLSYVPTGFTLNGLRIVNSPNMLQAFRNQIPFGLACNTTSNREPSQLEDFSSGTSILYVLSKDEVEQYNDYLTGNL